jgi:PhoH-like ATPase
MSAIELPPRAGSETARTYVLDMSVLLADPGALDRWAGHHLVLPIVVVDELEAKRHHPDFGWAARTVLRRLEASRTCTGTLQLPLPRDVGGTLRVELNHQEQSDLPPALHGSGSDHRILAVAAGLRAGGDDVVLITKDLPLRLRAGLVDVPAVDYEPHGGGVNDWSGIAEIDLTGEQMDTLYRSGTVEVDGLASVPVNTGLIARSPSQGALARLRCDGRLRLVRGDAEALGVRGRSAAQRLALDLLQDDEVGIVSLGGPAGTGKSALAIAAGLHAVISRGRYRRVVVFRPLYAIGGQDLGYLPGSEHEKMAPWADAVYDTLEAIMPAHVIDHARSEGFVDVLPLTHLRGRTFTDTWVIIDEAQNLERPVILTALSRLGENSRVVLTHDVDQRDNLRVGRNDGVLTVVRDLKGHPLFGHITLSRSERSPIAALVASLGGDGDTAARS